MRKNIVAGNWKMNKTLQEGLTLAKGIEAALAGKKVNCDVIIGTPFIHLASVAQAIDTKKSVLLRKTVPTRLRVPIPERFRPLWLPLPVRNM